MSWSNRYGKLMTKKARRPVSYAVNFGSARWLIKHSCLVKAGLSRVQVAFYEPSIERLRGRGVDSAPRTHTTDHMSAAFGNLRGWKA